MRKSIYLILCLLMSHVMSASEEGGAQTTHKIGDAVEESEKLYRQITQDDYAAAKTTLARLEKILPQYMGYYRSVYSLFINTCIEDLGINIGRDIANRYLSIYRDESIRVRAKKAADVAAELAFYDDYTGAVEVLDFIRQHDSDIEPAYYYRFLDDLAGYYNLCQNPQMSYILYEQCSQYYKNRYGETSRNYLQMLSNMAYVGRFTGKPTIDILLKIDSIYTTGQVSDPLSYAINLDNIGSAYEKRGDVALARTYMEKAYKTLETIEDVDSTHLAITLNNIGATYKTDDLEKSKHYLSKSIETFPTSHALINLAEIYEGENNLQAAHELYSQLSDYNRMVFSNLIAGHLARMNNWDEYVDMMSLFLNYSKHLISENISVMPENERTGFLEQLINVKEVGYLFDYAALGKDSRLPGLCYNYLLMTKSLLLDFKDNIENIVAQSSNRELKDEYNTLRILKINLENGRCPESYYKEREFRFLDKLKKIENFTGFIDVSFSDIASTMKDDEICIEFFIDPSKSFKIQDNSYLPSTNENAPLYLAVLHRDGVPKVVDTGISRKDLENFNVKRPELAEHLYQSISPLLHGVKTVYFSPTDFINIYPLESYLNDEDLHFIRLSSTRELLKKQPNDSNWDATLLGGLEYDMTMDELVRDSEMYPRRVRSINSASQKREGDLSIEPLEGTKEEVRGISHIWEQRFNKAPNLKMGVDGTEAYLKSISGNYGRVLHIATHGFANATNDYENRYSLANSGLLLSGATCSYETANPFPDDVEDGILTSAEISRLDMRGVELAVLSACETGLGYMSYDGMWGLQRGFKLAGTQTLLMSLWKVDDKATSELIQNFYRYWLQDGRHDMHAALTRAKDDIKRNPHWSASEFWAGFILLDAL